MLNLHFGKYLYRNSRKGHTNNLDDAIKDKKKSKLSFSVELNKENTSFSLFCRIDFAVNTVAGEKAKEMDDEPIRIDF